MLEVKGQNTLTLGVMSPMFSILMLFGKISVEIGLLWVLTLFNLIVPDPTDSQLSDFIILTFKLSFVNFS